MTLVVKEAVSYELTALCELTLPYSERPLKKKNNKKIQLTFPGLTDVANRNTPGWKSREENHVCGLCADLSNKACFFFFNHPCQK